LNTHILYNPGAGKGSGKSDAEALQILLSGETFIRDITEILNYRAFFAAISPTDKVILCGGDGTLNRFANETKNLCIRQELLYYPCGNGNDFARDLGYTEEMMPFRINDCLRDLPVVTVNGKESCFLNGIGFGIDGYCCAQGDALREKGERKVNYAAIAVHGILGGFTPVSAKISVDGKVKAYEHVWLAPTMLGRYYGGGMIPAPEQDRMSEERTLSVLVLHCRSRLAALCAFPSIFRGEMLKHEKIAELRTGREIFVEFDRPCALQIDGETICGVTSYRVAATKAEQEAVECEKL